MRRLSRRNAKTFAQTGMGRSFYRMTPDRAVENFKAKPFYHPLSSSYFTMISRDGKYFGPDGKETNVDEKAGRLRHRLGKPRPHTSSA
jgi:hypothetical protein